MLKETNMDTELKDLIGKKVTKLYVSSDYLRFDIEGESSLTYMVSGDCCSHSYFYDFYGVEHLLKNGKVTEVKQVELTPTDLMVTGGDMYDVIQVYGYQITTESENYGPVTSVFSFRNSSNGYYGGSIQKVDYAGAIPELTSDVVEVK